MKPTRTPLTNCVFKLPGGTDENDLPVQVAVDTEQRPVICSVWAPTEEERQAIARGVNIELCIWGDKQPPVSLALEEV